MPPGVIAATTRTSWSRPVRPAGCVRAVADLWSAAGPIVTGPARRPVVLVIGVSSGFGLAMTVAGLARHGIRGVGVALERGPAQRRAATAGWYRTIGLAALTRQAGSDFSFVNADAFADATKDHVLDLIEERFGGLDVLTYSVAASRRTDPDTGLTHRSVIKPLGGPRTTKTLEFAPDGSPVLGRLMMEPATEAEVAGTVEVMGGGDWSRWITALARRNLLRPGFRTVAASYVGSTVNAGFYRLGSLGRAKAHLERTARELCDTLAPAAGAAYTSVTSVAVTPASHAVPGVSLYISLLKAVLGERMPTMVDQSLRLWDRLSGASPLHVDGEGRIRLDDIESGAAVQAELVERWRAVTPANLTRLADVDWLRRETGRLVGFDVAGVEDDEQPPPSLAWPGIVLP
jgi:enoyl-[acyl-carrier protein] reductase/trans-2-enoyl-CoA reductase (NAD+)